MQRCKQTRTRYTQDIPQDIKPVVTEHIIDRDFCPCCKKHVEPKITDALPGSQIGHRVLVLTAWLHYGPGNTISAISSTDSGSNTNWDFSVWRTWDGSSSSDFPQFAAAS